MDDQVNPLERDHTLSVVLPGGLEKNATVHGSKPVMDLLVTLCASYHLNPSDYTVQVLSPNKNNISFKANSPIGSLEAEKIVLKPKGVEEKIKKTYLPEATVRLLISYKKSHKAVVRVNPRVPLELLMPSVCEKCEFRVETTILLRDSQSQEPLDMTKSLNDHGLREVFAKDTAAVTQTEVISPPPLQEDTNPPKKEKKQNKENKGFFSLFRRRKKKPETVCGELICSIIFCPGVSIFRRIHCFTLIDVLKHLIFVSPWDRDLLKHTTAHIFTTTHCSSMYDQTFSTLKDASVSAPASPALNKQLAVHSSNTLPADMPKKRPAPQPPMGASQSIPNNLSTHHLRGPQSSAESTLKRTKRRAPPPPCANANLELPPDTEVKGTANSLHILEELRESDESDSVRPSPSPSSSPRPSQSSSSSSAPSPVHLHEVNNPCLPTIGYTGKELPHARFTLAQILTSSVSSGTVLKRLKNSATFPRLYSGSSFVSATQKYAGNGGLCAELGSVLKSNPSTEDPIQRKGLTTFKVVPLKKQRSYEVELTLDVPDQCQILEENNPTSEASAEARDNQTETHKVPGSPERSETEISLPNSELCPLEVQVSDSLPSPPPLPDSENQDCQSSPIEENLEKLKEEDVPTELSPAASLVHSGGEHPVGSNFSLELERESLHSPSDQPPNTEMDLASLQADEKAIEEEGVQREEEYNFPPPPPPVFYHEEVDDMEEGRKEPVASCLPSSQPSSPTCNGQTDVFSGEESPTALKPLKRMSTVPSRFAQAVALAVQKSRFHSQGNVLRPQASRYPPNTFPKTPGPHANTVPDWLPHTSLNGSSCLG